MPARSPMIRTAARSLVATALVALLAVGAAACSGSEGADPTPTTDASRPSRPPSTNPAMKDLADLDGATNGLSGDELDCYNLSLAFVALSVAPLGLASGAGDPAAIQADVDTLRSQVPDPVAAAFDTYAGAVKAYAEDLEGVALDDLTDPATQQRLAAAARQLEAPEVVQATDELEAYFAATCPVGTTTTTAG